MAIRVEELTVPVPAVDQGEARIYRFPAPRRSRAELRRAAIARRRAVRRRRVAAAVTIVVVAVVMLFAGGPRASAPAAGHRAPRAIVVQPGQTLWSIADRYAGDGVDPRAYVDAILAVNGLDAPPVAGARIRLPR